MELQPGQKVLEIGPGATRIMRRTTHWKGATWHGIDPVWQNNPNRQAWKGTAAHIPFVDAFFDWVVAFDTMEHWEEFGETPVDGLKEIARVLKPCGELVVTVPIYLHGGFEFLSGDLQRIESYFLTDSWEPVWFEEWRRCPSPLLDWRGWDPAVSEVIPAGSSSWLLEIRTARR